MNVKPVDCQSFVLVSDKVLAQRREDIESSLPAGMSILPFSLSTAYTPEQIDALAAAFLSSDVLGESSRTILTPGMQKFCDMLTAAPNLKWLQLSSSGVDRTVFQNLCARGVRITTAAGVAADTVALTALTGMLCLSRKVPLWMESQRLKQWVPLRGEDTEPRELSGQRVLIVGTGRIGQALARLCKFVGLTTHGLRHSGPCQMENFDKVEGTDALRTAVSEADWIVAACPLTAQTQGMFDSKIFQSFKRSAFFINVARGGVVKERELIESLENRVFNGAYLDVFEEEPLPFDSPLWSLPNVLISPHCAGDTSGRHQRLADLFVSNLENYKNGRNYINEFRVIPDPGNAGS